MSSIIAGMLRLPTYPAGRGRPGVPGSGAVCGHYVEGIGDI
jgi:hypothetical protein